MSELEREFFGFLIFRKSITLYFFSQSEVESRLKYQQNLISQNGTIVLSSFAAKKDLFHFFPITTAKSFVLQFAVSNDKTLNSLKFLKEKYNISEKFFICSNQFWKHKNHRVILEALALVVIKDPNIRIIFTGKESDYRDPNHFEDLKKMVIDFNIQKYVLFLGFIDRVDQLSLMHYSHAVIQPSLFEGWSTVVEDAKSLGKLIIVSDLDVHREQLKASGLYFNPNSSTDLSNLLGKVWSEPCLKIDYSYAEKIIKFGSDFLKLLDSIFDERN